MDRKQITSKTKHNNHHNLDLKQLFSDLVSSCSYYPLMIMVSKVKT